MTYLRRISTRRLLALCAGVVVVGVATAAIALAATSGGPTPPPKPLPNAIHDALSAPKVAGVSARIEFTNHLLTSSNVRGSDPLLTGGTGRLWATSDGQLRLELQSDSGPGDSEVVLNRHRFLVYSGDSRTAYRGTLPREAGKHGHASAEKGPPSVSRIRRGLEKLAKHLNLSGAVPTDVAGRPAYSVRVSPKRHGGLLGGAQLAWDAVHGTPLEAGVYAKGSSSPVLELKVTDISFGPVSSSVFDISPAPGTKVTRVEPAKGHRTHHRAPAPVTGSGAVASKLSFPLRAPSSLAGMDRTGVHLIRGEKANGALVTYGRGLDGVAVVEYPASNHGESADHASGRSGELSVPKVSIGGVSADELETALGTALRFKRHGVEYVVAGSVHRAVAEQAARGL